MRKLLWLALAPGFLLAQSAFAQEPQSASLPPECQRWQQEMDLRLEMQSMKSVAPTAPAYLIWLQEQIDACKRGRGGSVDAPKKRSDGRWVPPPSRHIPSAIDRSHLYDNPPRLPVPGNAKDGRDRSKAGSQLPTSYDSRAQKRLPTIRNQEPFGACWAFAALGGAESNAISQGFVGANYIDLSEMFMGWFAYGDSRPGKAFPTDTSKDVLDQGGNVDRALAFMSRQGAINEVDLPYPTSHSYEPPAGVPEDHSRYPPVFHLREVWRLGDVNKPTWNAAANAWSTNLNATNQETIKRMIMEHGGVHTSYYSLGDAYYCPDNSRWEIYGDCQFGNGTTTAYFNNPPPECGNQPNGEPWPPEKCLVRQMNHDVLLVGWDDNFSRWSFRPGAQPQNNGAWLVRNSWGNQWGDGGYFWLSYEQHIGDSTVYIVAPDNTQRHYGHDDLGASLGWDYAWAASAFQAQDNETVEDIAFYTTDNNAQYEAYVYDLGTTPPDSTTVDKGVLLAIKRGTIPNEGYHRVALDSPVYVDAGHYFSVVLKMTLPLREDGTVYSYPMAAETRHAGKAAIKLGESWFSINKSWWQDGATLLFPSNAAIKAFASAHPSPLIKTDSLPDGIPGQEYGAQLQARGAQPVTWTKVSGALPSGLALSADGRISGTPTEGGVFTFTVTAANEWGSDAKELTLSIGGTGATAPAIETLSLDKGTLNVGYSARLEAQGTPFITWEVAGGVLPPGLSLSTAGRITGTPTQEGTFTFTVKASNAVGEDTKELAITVGAAPVIQTTELPGGKLGAPYAATLTAEGTPPVTWTKTGGSLATGLKLSPDGRITGAPAREGVFSLTAKATNAKGADSRTFQIIVGEPPAITTPPDILPAAVLGANYSFTLQASGTQPITWSGEGLPAWLKLASSSGKLTGKPAAEGAHTFTVKAANPLGEAAAQLTLAVGAKPAITTAALPGGARNAVYSAALEAAGTQPIAWTQSGGTLPPGLVLSADGRISGAPLYAGTFRFTVKAASAFGSATKTFRVVIAK